MPGDHLYKKTCNRSTQRLPAMLMLQITRYLRLMQAAAVAAGHVPHGLPQSISGLQWRDRQATGPSVLPGLPPSQTSSGDIRQLWGRMLRLSWVKENSSLTPPVRAKLLRVCQTRIIPRPQHSSSGCSQRSCINIIIFLILKSFGFETS